MVSSVLKLRRSDKLINNPSRNDNKKTAKTLVYEITHDFLKKRYTTRQAEMLKILDRKTCGNE
jgi:hypothetical protein